VLRFSIFSKIVLIVCFAIILPLVVSNYFIASTYQSFIDEYISGIKEIQTQFELFQKNIILQVFIVALLIFVIVAVVFFVLSRIIVRPLKKLVEATREVIKGNLNVKVSIRTRDELGVLSNSFNQMVEYLKKAFREADEERNKTMGVILNLVDGILVFDKKNCLKIINPQAEKILKVANHRDVIDKNLNELKKLDPFTSLIDLIGEKEIKQVFKKEICFDKTSVKGEKSLIFEVSTVPLLYKKDFFGNIVILHDITREKTVEKLKSEFISLSAHQLFTPSVAIKWSLDAILKEKMGKLGDKQKEFLNKTYLSSEKMVALIDDLLNITKIEGGRFLGKLTQESMEDLVRKSIQSQEKLIKEKNIELNLFVPKEPLPKIEANREDIILALKNLINNAIKYNSVGGKVTIELSRDKMEERVQIKDTGSGIPELQRSQVFSMFFRGDNAMKMGVSGTGLGLYLAKSIIEAHNGKIGFESEENKGSTFWFTLPIIANGK